MIKIVKDNLKYILSIISIVIIFFLIYKSPFYKNILEFDLMIADFISTIRNQNFTLIFNLFTFIGDFHIPVLIIMCIILVMKNNYFAYALGSSYLLSGAVAFVTKFIIDRPRPLSPIVEIPDPYSFPSGHTLTSFVFWISLWYVMTLHSKNRMKNISGIIFGLVVVMIAFSRLYLGVHYFSDVMGALILGYPCILMLKNIINNNYKKNLKKVC